MRLIDVTKVKEGDVIARDIISYDGGILLKRSTFFKEVFRQKLIDRNIGEIYIEDKISKGIEPPEIIPLEVKRKILNDVKVEFKKIGDSLQVDTETISEMCATLIQQLSSKDLVCEITDLKLNDNYTYEHCIGVGILTAIVCNKLQLNQIHTHKIVMGGLLHDIGKIIIPKEILNKPDKLTKEEYQQVKAHPTIGYQMIKDNDAISPVTKVAVLCHHERENGAGYPLGKGADLHIGGKIVAACDVFHALLSDRPYRQALPVNEAIAIAKTEQLNEEVRRAIEGVLAFYPVGTTLLLSNGEVAIVEKNFATDVARPLVRVIGTPHEKYKTFYKINLHEDHKIRIVKKITFIPGVDK